MSKDLDMEIYGIIADQINVSEIYLGHVEYEFNYTKVDYRATCTEAFPFNPFDKVICELLRIEEVLSFHEIGKILGLNVGDVENEKSIKDNAEYEILIDALQSLSDFSMVEGGDINFSRCHLTPIGREYADKKHKFRKTENKPFSLYFDNTTGNHKQAKAHFEFADGEATYLFSDLLEVGQFDLKEIAAVQVPNICNPSKLYSFLNEIAEEVEGYSITYPIGITFDFIKEEFNYYCFDHSKKDIHSVFSNWLKYQVEIASALIKKLQQNYPIILSSSRRAQPFKSRELSRNNLTFTKKNGICEKVPLQNHNGWRS